MRYHIAFGKPTDLDAIARQVAAGEHPDHVVRHVAAQLDAAVHQPPKPNDHAAVTTLDTLRAKLFGTPQQWALARTLAPELTDDDTIYCTGEDIGLPLAALCRRHPRIVIFTHNLNRLRARTALRVFRCLHAVDLWITNARPQEHFLRHALGLPADRVAFLPEQTNPLFFTPGPTSPLKRRATIASVGLECRDYKTLAAATADLDVDVRISGFSPDARAMADAFPNPLPANMDRRFYSWPNLVQLYRDADVVLVSVRQNQFCAGLTTAMEAAACARPLVITRTPGLEGYFDDPALALPVPPADPAAMRSAIQRLLANPREASALGQRAHAHLLAHHTAQQWTTRLLDLLTTPVGQLA